jgi:hypothetical protein
MDMPAVAEADDGRSKGEFALTLTLTLTLTFAPVSISRLRHRGGGSDDGSNCGKKGNGGAAGCCKAPDQLPPRTSVHSNRFRGQQATATQLAQSEGDNFFINRKTSRLR